MFKTLSARLAASQAILFFMILGIAAYALLVREKYAPREARP